MSNNLKRFDREHRPVVNKSTQRTSESVKNIVAPKMLSQEERATLETANKIKTASILAHAQRVLNQSQPKALLELGLNPKDYPTPNVTDLESSNKPIITNKTAANIALYLLNKSQKQLQRLEATNPSKQNSTFGLELLNNIDYLQSDLGHQFSDTEKDLLFKEILRHLQTQPNLLHSLALAAREKTLLFQKKSMPVSQADHRSQKQN